MQPTLQSNYTTPVVKNLIIINVIFYILTHYLMPNLFGLTALYYPMQGGLFRPYQLITYMFSHASFMHILFNMLALWMLGSQIEQYWGPRKFLAFYLICGIGSALFNFGVDYIHLQQLMANDPGNYDAILAINHSSVIGASGAVFGILAAFGFMFPNVILMSLFPPIPMKAKYFVIIYSVIELYSGFENEPGDLVGHFAHIGGLVTGLILLLYLRQRGHLYNSYW